MPYMNRSAVIVQLPSLSSSKELGYILRARTSSYDVRRQSSAEERRVCNR